MKWADDFYKEQVSATRKTGRLASVLGIIVIVFFGFQDILSLQMPYLLIWRAFPVLVFIVFFTLSFFDSTDKRILPLYILFLASIMIMIGGINFTIILQENVETSIFAGLTNGIILAVVSVYIISAGARKYLVWILAVPVIAITVLVYGFSNLGDIEKSYFSSPFIITIIIIFLARLRDKREYDAFTLRKHAEEQKGKLEWEVNIRKNLQNQVRNESRKSRKLFSVLSGIAGNLKKEQLYKDIQEIMISNFAPEYLGLFLSFNVTDVDKAVLYSRDSKHSFPDIADSEMRRIMNGHAVVYLPQFGKQGIPFLGIPVAGAQNNLGTIFISGSDSEFNSIYDNDFLLSLGRQLGLVLENALFYEKVEKSANEDPLTLLSNRRAAVRFLENEISRFQRYKQPFCVAIMDIDHFKQINDMYGHDVGDKILKASGQMYKRSIRSTDFVARWGGEEFMIIFIGCDTVHVKQLVERIRQYQEDLSIEVDGRPVYATVSIGVTEYQGNETLDQCVKRADEALYEAKSRGRNCVVIE